jgi:RNA polymerase sigma factor (sigma-70 family)
MGIWTGFSQEGLLPELTPATMRDVAITPPGSTQEGASNDSADAEARLRDWIAAAARGDHAAFTQLYRATTDKVFALAQRITRRAVLAEEVVIETYAQAWRLAGQYNPARSKVQTWLLTLCRSRAIDALRRLDPAEALAEQHDAEDTAPTPLDLLQQTELNASIHHALTVLDARQRQLLTLAFFRDMSHSELASYTGIPLGTVKSLLRTGIEQLRAVLSTGGIAQGGEA